MQVSLSSYLQMYIFIIMIAEQTLICVKQQSLTHVESLISTQWEVHSLQPYMIKFVSILSMYCFYCNIRISEYNEIQPKYLGTICLSVSLSPAVFS